jgi:hypothetical protein
VVDAAEGEQGQENRQPEKDDLEHAQGGRAQAEEEARPEQVQEKLDQKSIRGRRCLAQPPCRQTLQAATAMAR